MLVNKITNESVTINAPAKINLFLEVLNKREDGFHNINSLFQAVSLFDRLEISIKHKSGCDIILLNNKDLPTDNDNLIAKTFKLLTSEFNLKKGITVKIEKNIPIAAGLGGGSADAAATIMGCNVLFNLGLSKQEMAVLGLKLGSDIPFFFSSGQALISGRGEIIKESTFPIDYHLVLVNPNISVSTASSYSVLKRGLTNFKNPFNLAPCRTVEELVEQLRLCGNDFEEVHLKSFEVLQRIKDELLQLGALLVRMSGSGPTMFGIFKDLPNIDKSGINSSHDWLVYTVGPIRLHE